MPERVRMCEILYFIGMKNVVFSLFFDFWKKDLPAPSVFNKTGFKFDSLFLFLEIMTIIYGMCCF